MHGDMASLYDAHADRLYAYCWSLVGDRRAEAAVADAFAAAVHRPPRGDAVLWLYSLARSACAEHGAFTGELGGRGAPLFTDPDPLLRAASSLRADHREVLLLRAGEWLDVPDVARVVGLAPDTVAQLLGVARARLERTVLDGVMRGTTAAPAELITAFEKNRLPRLLARKAPSRAPGPLRDRVLAACEEETTRPLPGITAPSPLVVIGTDEAGEAGNGGRARGGVSKGLGAAAGIAASAAAVVGLLATWPSSKGGDAASVVPSSGGETNRASSTGAPRHPSPDLAESGRATGGPADGPATGAPGAPAPGGGTGAAPGGGTAAAPPATTPSSGAAPTGSASPSGTPSSTPPETTPSTSPGTPTPPESPSTPPDGGTPTGTPTAPPDDGSGGPTTPPPGTPSDPPSDAPGTPSPSPTSNPTPSPSG